MNYTLSAAYYDILYSEKDYQGEADRLRKIIRGSLKTSGRRLLDVACGSGQHLACLAGDFEAHGLDIEEGLLELACKRLPGVPLHQGDMRTFDLGERFDVVTCLFSAIGYMHTLDDLNTAVAQMGKHLVPGGLLIIEPWFSPDQYHPDTVHMLTVDEPELKIVRMNSSLLRGHLSVIDFHYLVGTPKETVHFTELHELAMYTREEMENSFRKAGLGVRFDEEGLTGRGLYIGERLA
jgi:SAM-dependent methyltransferase